MSNNIVQNFEEASGRSFEDVKNTVFEMLAAAYDSEYDDEGYYELCSELTQNFLAGLAGIGLGYPELNQVSSFLMALFFSE